VAKGNGGKLVAPRPSVSGRRYQMPIATIRSKYLNNIIEQNHRFIERRTRPMLGFKSLSSASATLEGIEVTHMIRKKQFDSDGSGFVLFASLAG